MISVGEILVLAFGFIPRTTSEVAEDRIGLR